MGIRAEVCVHLVMAILLCQALGGVPKFVLVLSVRTGFDERVNHIEMSEVAL